MRGLKIIFFIILLLFGFKAYCQPSVIGTSAFNYPTFTFYSLSTLGKLKQYRAICNSSTAAGNAKWLFCRGTAGSPDFNIKWNPYTIGQTIPAFDSIINPTFSTGSARYNTSGGGGGQDGQLLAIVSGRYYTFNIGDLSNANNFMAVWETTFNPVNIISTTQSPGVVCSTGDSITISVLTSSAPNLLEKVFVRYTRDSSFSPSYLVQLSFSGSTGSAKIPVLNAGDTIRYYVFTSKLSQSQLAPGGIVSETNCDMSTLTMNNNSNNNFRFIISSAPSPISAFSAGAACVGVATSFTNNSSISSGTISTSNWAYGDTGTGSGSGISNSTHTYSSTGNYQVTLIVASNNGCQKSSNQTIQVNPKPTTNGLLPH